MKKLSEVKTELAERVKPDGRRRIKLTLDERENLLRQQRIETAVVLFTDLQTVRKWSEIAEELGISVKELKALTKTPEFEEAYNAVMTEIGHDPRYRAAAAGIADLLPKAVRTLDQLLTTAPPHVKLQAVQTVFKAANLEIKPPEVHSDREELVKFLSEQGIDINLNVNLPVEYAAAMQKYGGAVDGEFTEVQPAQLPADATSGDLRALLATPSEDGESDH